MEEDLQRLSTRPEFSPVLLAWMLMDTTGSSLSRQFGEKAINQRILKIVSDICTDPVVQVNLIVIIQSLNNRLTNVV